MLLEFLFSFFPPLAPCWMWQGKQCHAGKNSCWEKKNDVFFSLKKKTNICDGLGAPGRARSFLNIWITLSRRHPPSCPAQGRESLYLRCKGREIKAGEKEKPRVTRVDGHMDAQGCVPPKRCDRAERGGSRVVQLPQLPHLSVFVSAFPDRQRCLKVLINR